VSDRTFVVLLKTDLAGTPPAHASGPSPKTLYFVTIYRRFIGNKYLGREWYLLIVIPKPTPLLMCLSPFDQTKNLLQRQHGWRTAKRPGVDYFIAYLSQFYEVVIFTTQHHYVRHTFLSENLLLTERCHRPRCQLSKSWIRTTSLSCTSSSASPRAAPRVVQ
jgi:hypothetical protein